MIRSDGVYKNQTNPKEAADVVEYLSNLWEEASPPSVGVVTFNRKQADAIEDALGCAFDEQPVSPEVIAASRPRWRLP